MAKKAAERRAARRERRDFAEVASQAAEDAAMSREITAGQHEAIQRALRRPRGVELIRSTFAQDAGPEQLKLGEVLTGPGKGKIDFDKLFSALTLFFPKLAGLKKYVGIFQRIRDIAKEVGK